VGPVKAPGSGSTSFAAGQGSGDSSARELVNAPALNGEQPWKDFPDQDLLQLCSSDERAVWALWCRYSRHLEYVVIGLTHLPTWDVEEIMSTAALRFHRQVPRYASQIRNLQAWMSTLVRNVALDYVRKAGRFQRQHLNLEENDLAQSPDWECLLPGRSHTASLEIREAIRSEINSLSLRLRETARAHFLEEKSYSEICRLQHIRPATARKRIQMARAQLRQSLVGYLSGQRPLPGERTSAVVEVSAGPRFEIECSPVSSRFVSLPGPGRAPQFHHLFFCHPLGREQQKMSRLRDYVGRHSRGWLKQWELAEISLSLGRWEEALGRYELCRKHKSAKLSAFLRPARLLHHVGREEEARLLCMEALRSEHDPASRFHLHAVIAEIMNQSEHARAFWLQARTAEPQNPAHYVGAAELEIRSGNAPAAIRVLDELLQLDADHLQGRNLLLDLMFERGDLGAVYESVKKLLSRGDSNAKVIQYNMDFHLGIASPREWMQLRRTLASMLDETPGLGRLLEARALVCAGRRRWRSLEVSLEDIVRSYPESPEAWRIRSSWLARTRRPSAVAALMQAFECFPGDPALLETAAYLSMQEEHASLFSHFLGQSSSFSRNPRLLLAAAIGLSTLMKTQERAWELVHEATEFKPDDPAVWLGLGCILLKGSRLPDAIQALERSWSLATARPTNLMAPIAALYLAHAFKLFGRSHDSLEWYSACASAARSLPKCSSLFTPSWRGLEDSAANSRRTIAGDLDRVWEFLWRPFHFVGFPADLRMQDHQQDHCLSLSHRTSQDHADPENEVWRTAREVS
jgi:RNA polymerase sigma factor (sigma-70 family)